MNDERESPPEVQVIKAEHDANARNSGRDWNEIRRELVPGDGDLAVELEYLIARARKERKRQGLTQQAIADRMSVSQSRVSAIETGQVNAAEVGTLSRYLRALGIRPRLTAEFGS